MQNRLTAIIKENLEASFAIANNLNTTLKSISKEFGEQVEAAFADSEFECDYEVDFHNNYTGIWFYREDWKYVKIGFQFQAKNRDLLYGFTKHYNELGEPSKIPADLELALSQLGDNIKKENEWWPWRQYVDEPYRDWTKLEAWQAIQNGTMLNMIQHHVKTLSDLVTGGKIASMLRGDEVEAV
jgi:hypothetical protein